MQPARKLPILCRFSTLLLLFVLLGNTSAAPRDVNLNDAKRYRFSAPHKSIVALEAMHSGVIVDEATRYDEAVVWATPEGVANLSASGFALVEDPLETHSADWWNAYPSIQQVSDSLVALARRHPNSAKVDTVGYTVLNRPMVTITIGNNVNAADFLNKPSIMLFGSIHGNEKPGTPILMNFAEYLLDSTSADPRLGRLLQECRVHIMPVINPDGYVRNVRQNQNGIDINRSFPCKTTSDSLDSETGRAPETQAIMRWTRLLKPLIGLNMHTGAVVANYPNDSDYDIGAVTSYPVQPDKQWFIAAADSYAVHNPTMFANNSSGFHHGTVNGAEWYHITGGLQDYQYRFHNTRHLTVEISTAQPPAASWLPTGWAENKNALLAYCSLVWQGIDVTVTPTNALTADSYGDLGFETMKYNRLGTSNTFRFLLPPGSFKPRVYTPYSFSSWSERQYPFDGMASHPITANTLSTMSANPLDSRPDLISSLENFYGWDRVPYDSLRFSPYQEIPNRWDSARTYELTYGYYIVDPVCSGLSDRNWLVKSLRPNSFYFPTISQLMTADYGPNIFTSLDTVLNFTTSAAGTGTALQFTATGREGGGMTDSPVGNYANNVDVDYFFTGLAAPLLLTTPIDSALARISFSYRGNMEGGADYWAIAIRVGDGEYVPMDTLTGIFTQTRIWYRDLPIAAPTTLSLRIHVHTDGSVQRDGYIIDDLTLSRINFFMWDGISEKPSSVPTTFALSCYPNPFNATMQIALSLPVSGMTKVTLYDVTGREVALLAQQSMSAGTTCFTLNGTMLSSGVYFLRAQQGTNILTQKVALMK